MPASGAITTAGIDRVRLEALRYAVNEEAVQYIAIMRLFTSGLSGLLSDQSAAEVAARLANQGMELDDDTVEARLSYLVEHGNLARSPRETEARSLTDYLRNRARYQLSQRGELVHRQVEELLGYSESAREVSSEMLGAILAGLRLLVRYDEGSLAAAEPDVVAREIGTVFAQFDRLVHSTREFYTYLTQVLTRYDLDRGEFQAFKTALLDYLQRFVDEVQRHMPQIAEVLADLAPRVVAICERANAGQRLLDLEGRQAQRAPGLSPQDWQSLRAWFTGEGGRSSDADVVRAWPPRRCAHSSLTCGGSPRVRSVSMGATRTWCGWPGGSTRLPTQTRTRCGPARSGCTPAVTLASSPATTNDRCHRPRRGGKRRRPRCR